jgi:mono/diheme cytochrome c family protein
VKSNFLSVFVRVNQWPQLGFVHVLHIRSILSNVSLKENSPMRKDLLTTASVLALMAGTVVFAFGGNTTLANAGSEAQGQSAATLYAKHCVSCHGRDGRSKTSKGKRNHARNLTETDWQGAVSDERVFNSIANGRGKMPAFSKKMSDAEIDAMVSYVRALH